MEIVLLILAAVSFAAFSSDSGDPVEKEVVDPDEGELPPEPETPVAPNPPTVVEPPFVPDGIVATDGDDSLTGTENADLIEAMDGNDTVSGMGGDDTILGQNGDDILNGGADNDFIDGGLGDDTLLGSDIVPADEISESDSDTIIGGGGNDYLRGYNGNDSLRGGSGSDTIWSDTGDDTLNGGSGNDELRAMEGDDLLVGGDGNDDLAGGRGSDTIFGGAGNDVLVSRGIAGANPGPNNDFLDGGEGDDILRGDRGSTLTGGLGADTMTLEESISDTLVPQIIDYDPTVDSLHIDIIAGDGDGGAFTLQPRSDGDGSNLYLGDDLVAEFLGTSPLTLTDITLVVRLESSDGSTTEYTLGESVDGSYVIGSYGDDDISASNSGDVISGVNGSDVLNGGAGNDTIFADGGSVFTYDHETETNTLLETDTVSGGGGDDVIFSVNGNMITGGEGDDLFVIQHDLDTLRADEPLPPTIITDFIAGEDTILVRTIPGSRLDPLILSLTPLEDDTGAELRQEGEVIAVIIGGQDLTLADINVGEMSNGEYVPYAPYNLIPRYLS
ncbi:calcium-binding protein [Sulfitobacter sp. F26169L]|uniref:calcium-binding protein n=1 Tax=Sulfitobacter sp. F26169L TaxID=2996015 RepID=UPI0022608243|nr:calcium-binding protein [Sulfitobacter sp. F26169L]MCX7566482.1 calcium-binding protein [Sulfitobacter sp. F26169L]